jgi:hypothetical protein
MTQTFINFSSRSLSLLSRIFSFSSSWNHRSCNKHNACFNNILKRSYQIDSYTLPLNESVAVEVPRSGSGTGTDAGLGSLRSRASGFHYEVENEDEIWRKKSKDSWAYVTSFTRRPFDTRRNIIGSRLVFKYPVHMHNVTFSSTFLRNTRAALQNRNRNPFLFPFPRLGCNVLTNNLIEVENERKI